MPDRETVTTPRSGNRVVPRLPGSLDPLRGTEETGDYSQEAQAKRIAMLIDAATRFRDSGKRPTPQERRAAETVGWSTTQAPPHEIAVLMGSFTTAQITQKLMEVHQNPFFEEWPVDKNTRNPFAGASSAPVPPYEQPAEES